MESRVGNVSHLNPIIMWETPRYGACLWWQKWAKQALECTL